jgi:hypothetical protein
MIMMDLQGNERAPHRGDRQRTGAGAAQDYELTHG